MRFGAESRRKARVEAAGYIPADGVGLQNVDRATRENTERFNDLKS